MSDAPFPIDARSFEHFPGEPAPRAEPCTLRPLRAGDIGWVVSRHGALYAAEFGFDMRFEAVVARIAADFIDRFDAPREACWIAERTGEPAGTPLGSVFLVQARDETTRAPIDGTAQLRLLLIEQTVKNLRAEFKPGSAPGRSVLNVTVEEGAQFNTNARLANDRSPSAGEVRAEVGAGVRNLLGYGDQIDLTLGKSAGLHDFDLRFRLPINGFGTEFAGRYSIYSSQLVEEQFAILDAKTRSRGAEFGVPRPKPPGRRCHPSAC